MERLTTNHGRARRVLLAAMFLIVAAALHGQEADFRELRWGMTVEEVHEIEGIPRLEIPKNLLYEVRVGGLDADLYLYFDEGGLYQALYVFQEEHVDRNNYLRDFDRIGQLLRPVHGDPQELDNSYAWYGSLNRDDRDHWGVAVATGQLSILSRWKSDRTVINHFLRGENHNVVHTIAYASL